MDVGEDTPATEGGSILWDVRSPGSPATKSLVNDVGQLIRSCTPTDVRVDAESFGEGKSIGFWADYVNPDGTIVSDVFGSTVTQLMHFDKHDGRGKAWNYQANDLLWAIGGRYLIRSYYPQVMREAVVTSSSDAELFVLEYNTHRYQEDLMVAYNSVYTIDPVDESMASIYRSAENSHSEVTYSEDFTKEGFSQAFDLRDPIPLFFRHTMAAVRLRVTFDHDNTDELLSVEFFNAGNDGFHNVGLLVYGEASTNQSNGFELSASSLSGQDGPDSFNWVTYQSSYDSEPFYQWTVAGEQGVEFSRTTTGSGVVEKMAVPYYERKHWIQRTNGSSELELDGDPVTLSDGSLYSSNDGWVLIVPQHQPSNVWMRLRTKNMGERVVHIPQLTGTNIDGTPSPTGEYLVAAHKYTYTIVFRHTDLDVRINIAPWNEIKANVDIEL